MIAPEIQDTLVIFTVSINQRSKRYVFWLGLKADKTTTFDIVSRNPGPGDPEFSGGQTHSPDGCTPTAKNAYRI
jgi:hypothetical protein